MFRKSFKVKIILPSILILSILLISLNVFLSERFSSLNDAIINEKLAININSLLFYLDDNKAKTKTAAVSMSFNVNAIKAIKEHDTQELLRVFAPMHAEYQVGFYTITDNEGIVLARTHAPDSFGDSILYQYNIKNALHGAVSTCFEPGSVVRVSARTAAPVHDTDGSLVGVVLAGVRFDLDSEVERLKKLFKAEVAIYVGDTRIATTITKDGHSIAETLLDPNIAETVIKNKQEYTVGKDAFGEKYKTYYKPVLDSEDKVFAVFFFGMPETDLVKATNNVSRDGIIFGFIGLGISVIFIFFIMSSVSEPIILLSKNMGHIADGNLRVAIKIEGEDEVGHLSKSLQNIVNILHKLIFDINVMIDEHKKGNTEYDLKTEYFNGDYRVLAESVSELSNFSMKDQLTGLPNRRSFNNRLHLELSRAERYKIPISILMMDIDKFKVYNDTFGHQQGDIALQTVANTLQQALKRAIDFVARWGGEEFVVLLANTDASGAVAVAEKIRAAVEKTVIPCNEEQGRKATVSIGVNTLIPEQGYSDKDFISAADSALYKAKETGRNRVCHYAESRSALKPRLTTN